jgi:hypothetical protein
MASQNSSSYGDDSDSWVGYWDEGKFIFCLKEHYLTSHLYVSRLFMLIIHCTAGDLIVLNIFKNNI